MTYNKGNGKGIIWLREHIAHDGDDCLIWPYARSGPFGYGALGYNGKNYYAHTLMCELANGPKPTPKHQAAHNCGKGNTGCVHPKHLEWKTGRANQLDRRRHGTKAFGGRRGPHRKLTPQDVETIRYFKGIKTQMALAAEFGVSDTTIRDIYSGKSWVNPDRVFSDNEVLEMRRLAQTQPMSEIARMFDAKYSKIRRIIIGRTYRHVA